jgi:7-carboxy-7-deazaguanine synthase
MRINRIFNSINGEITSLFQGSISTFIRLQGCNLRCSYCDTKYAQNFKEGREMSIDDIIHEVYRIGCKNITITGGEPLLQKIELYELIGYLLNHGYKITLETNGSFSFERYVKYTNKWENLSIVADYKIADSSEMNNNLFSQLWSTDWIKFVILTKQDFIHSIEVRKKLKGNGCKAKFAYSPVFRGPKYSGSSSTILNPNTLLEWLKEYNLYDSYINIQLHKLINLKE